MKRKTGHLDKNLADRPIALPPNPFWDVFKRFGRDEAISMFINVLATWAIGLFFASKVLNVLIGPISRRTKDLIVSLSGPIAEKAGFFPGHFRDAWLSYKKTPKNKRDGFTTYLKKAANGSMKSLVEDILVHDPIYIFLMLVGLKAYPATPAWILSFASFIIAILMVSIIEVGLTELAYLNFKRSLKKAGFGMEPYLESRFYIGSEVSREKVLKKISEKFNLKIYRKIRYENSYFHSRLPEYSGRKAYLRLRRRESGDGKSWIQTAQIIYTRAAEMDKGQRSQFRYFPIRKDKFWFILDQKMPCSFDGIKNLKIRRILKRAEKGGKACDIVFERRIARDPKTLLVSVDYSYDEGSRSPKKDFFIVEIKSYLHSKKLLKEAMHYVMKEFPVVQTTHSKVELCFFNRPRA